MENYNERYARHYSLKNFGIDAQQKLEKAKVLVIGAGGLGCPVLQYLAAAGVGTIGIADNDILSLSNLQRQVLYTTNDIGKPKTEVAEERLKRLNPGVEIAIHQTNISTANALEILQIYDVVVDCTDNFTARYIINDACVLLGKPLVFGAIYQYEGQVAVFNVLDDKGIRTNYRHLFPEPPAPGEAPDCNEAGVLGVLPGVIGIMQATEVIKLVTGIGEVLVNKILNFSLLSYVSVQFGIDGNAVDNAGPKTEAEFRNIDYEVLCGVTSRNIVALEASVFKEWAAYPDTIVIDVRERNEQPKSKFAQINIPLAELENYEPGLTEENILLFCQSGKRSLKAAELLASRFGSSKNIAHLKGGIISLQE